MQDFYGHFQEQEGPKRLLGFSKAGKQHYASPSELRIILRPPLGRHICPDLACLSLRLSFCQAE